jgi:hypothetical protein
MRWMLILALNLGHVAFGACDATLTGGPRRIQFNGQTFYSAFWQRTPILTNEEFIPAGETLENWREMLSLEDMPETATSAQLIGQMRRDSVKIAILDGSSEGSLFDFTTNNRGQTVYNMTRVFRQGPLIRFYRYASRLQPEMSPYRSTLMTALNDLRLEISSGYRGPE